MDAGSLLNGLVGGDMSVRKAMRLEYYSSLEDENEKLKEQNEQLIEALECIEPMIREAAKIDGRWNVETINRNNTPVYSVNGCELTLAHCDKILSALNSIKEATQ